MSLTPVHWQPGRDGLRFAMSWRHADGDVLQLASDDLVDDVAQVFDVPWKSIVCGFAQLIPLGKRQVMLLDRQTQRQLTSA